MVRLQKRGSRQTLIATIVLVVLVAGATDAIIRALGWNQPPGELWPSFAPRGAVIGAIWVVLFGCMGGAAWLAGQRQSSRPADAANVRLIASLMIACLAYPFYTHFVPGHRTELAGNVVTFALAGTIASRLWDRSRTAALLVGLVAAWIVFATVLVFALAGLNGWGP